MTSKKKISQNELRRLMNEQKKKLLNNVKKIESPLARYDKDGNLTCIVCESIVRSEAVWTVHLNSKSHRQNIANKVKKRDEPPAPAPAPPPPVEKFAKPAVPTLKRPAPPPVPVCTKKIKSILKNAPTDPKYERIPSDFFDSVQPMETESVPSNKTDNSETVENEEMEEEVEIEVSNGELLPEGFFDDPKLDAKARNKEYKDPIEEEWEQFQKAIKEETSKAQQIISEEQDEATAERQIDEIDEQMRNWSRVLDLEKKKQRVISVPANQSQTIKEEDSSGDENEFEEFVNWRSKKSFV